MRLVYEDGAKGPIRAVHAGSGFLSQDSSVQNLGAAREPSGIWVRWPGGQTTTSPLPKGKLKVEITPDGVATVLP